MPMIRVRNRVSSGQKASTSIAIIRLFSVNHPRMKNPHNRNVDIPTPKPLYNCTACIYAGLYCSRISRYSERVLQGDYHQRPQAK